MNRKIIIRLNSLVQQRISKLSTSNGKAESSIKNIPATENVITSETTPVNGKFSFMKKYNTL